MKITEAITYAAAHGSMEDLSITERQTFALPIASLWYSHHKHQATLPTQLAELLRMTALITALIAGLAVEVCLSDEGDLDFAFLAETSVEKVQP